MLGNVKGVGGKLFHFDKSIFSEAWNLKIAQLHGVHNSSILRIGGLVKNRLGKLLKSFNLQELFIIYYMNDTVYLYFITDHG